MCGIYGILGEPYGNPEIGLRSLQHRGPDNHGIWRGKAHEPWLGHRRLSIIDRRAVSDQPMVSADGRYILSYNGEIYNFLQLRQTLESKGYSFQTQSDTEVLLTLFAAEGEECLCRLNGIFSFAIWDRKSQILTVARDPLGVKPLYIAHDDHRFAFASELKALVRSGEVQPELDPEAVARHLVFLWSPGGSTILRQVSKVLPGEVLRIANDLSFTRRIYRDGSLGRPQGSLPPKDYTPAAVAQQLKAAVERQMVADVPVGAFLSGGLDSSAVCAFARTHLPVGKKLDCFTMQNSSRLAGKDGFVDDLPYARKVANHLDVNLHVVDVDDRLNDRLMEYLYYLDEPTADPAGLNALAIAELARDNGLKVLLSGAGGDDVFTGYRRHQAVVAAQYMHRIPAPLYRGLAGLTRALPAKPALFRRLKKLGHSLDQDRNEFLVRLFQWQPPQSIIPLMSKDFTHGMSAADINSPLFQTLSEAPENYDMIQSILRLETKHFLADHNLNYTDKTGMAAGIEVRVPFLDLELMEYAHAIPSQLKQKGRTGKWILKKAMEPYLPHEVIYRPKTGFGVPLRAWFLGPMRGLMEDTLSNNSITSRGIFDHAAVEQFKQATLSGKVDGIYTLFAIICLELWCRQFIDQHWAVELKVRDSDRK